MTRKEYVQKFIAFMNEEGEHFFSSGNANTDYKNITMTLKNQGFWAGVKYRYYFNDDLSIKKIEERIFA